MFKVLMALLMMATAGTVVSSRAVADTPTQVLASTPETKLLSEFEPTRTTTVYRCKINGRWRPGRCPANRKVNCVHHRTGKFRHAGRCRSASR